MLLTGVLALALPALAAALACPAAVSGAEVSISQGDRPAFDQTEREMASARAELEGLLGELRGLQAGYRDLSLFKRARERREALVGKAGVLYKRFDEQLQHYKKLNQAANQELAADALAQLLTTGVKKLEIGPALRAQRVLKEGGDFEAGVARALTEEKADYERAEKFLFLRRVGLLAGWSALLIFLGAWQARRRRRWVEASLSPGIPLTTRFEKKD